MAVGFCANAESDRLVRLDAGVASGYIFYGDEQVPALNENLNNGIYNRFFIGPLISLSFKIAKPCKFVLGSETFFDLAWNGSYYNRHFDYSVYGGIKFYPGLKGFNIGAYYAGGQRLDYSNCCNPGFNSTSWGNGFRFTLEYDFLYESSSEVMPVFGISYRFMPRGDNFYDSILTGYMTLAY